MKRAAVVLLCLLLGTGFAQPKSGLEKVKQRALETARTLTQAPFFNADKRFYSKNKGTNRCAFGKNQLYAGHPFLVRTLIRPTKRDLEQLRERVSKAIKEPGFIGNPKDEVKAARLNQDFYEVPIYDRVCGYLFHIRSRTGPNAPVVAGEFKPINMKTAQRLLGTKQPPIFVAFYESLTPENDGYLWVSGTRAVDAFRRNRRYCIVNVQGEPVAPLEIQLTPRIFRESFVTSMGDPSAWWHFQLPVRLEPLPSKP